MTDDAERKRMKAFVIAERLKEWDTSVFATYGPLAAASIAKFGGRYLALSTAIVSLEGPSPPLAIGVIEFPSVEQARNWYASNEYQDAALIRRSGAENRFILVAEDAAAHLVPQLAQVDDE
ncbi:DUF1330 domain-containing protein [Dyella jejuensis]|uniref:DUF1330 domain-containing protein n=1 Tax=Dyella jejuensis TaxID=1432009 RepID=A0ABW8JM98_9GAMM